MLGAETPGLGEGRSPAVGVCWRAIRLAGLLGLCLLGAAGAAAAGSGLADARWVLQQPATVPMPEALTRDELRALHAEAVASSHRLECLGWIYRGGPGASSAPVGVSFQRAGVAIKLGGTIRRGSPLTPADYDQAARDRRALSAVVIVQDFGQTFHLHGNDFPQAPPSAHYWVLQSGQLQVQAKRQKCRNARAHCRLYAGVGQVDWRDRSALLAVQPGQRSEAGIDIDLEIEDMCPATTHGAVEGPWRKARDIGGGTADQVNRLVKGILGNPGLKQALK